MEYLITRGESQNELMHWGKKGQKWGVRRYQNPDGTLTEAGKKRYARDAREKGYKEYDESTGVRYKNTKKGRDDLDVDAGRYVKEDLERTKNLTENTGRLTSDIKRITDKSIKNAPRPRMDLSNMTEKEMRDAINREFLERQYNDMFAPQAQTKGRERVSKVMEVAGDVLAVTGTALGIAVSIKQLLGDK